MSLAEIVAWGLWCGLAAHHLKSWFLTWFCYFVAAVIFTVIRSHV